MNWSPDAPRIGTWVKIPAPEVLEAIHAGGLRLVVIDGEHGAIGRRAMWSMVGLARALGLVVLVRVAGHGAEHAQAALDAGADGLVVPRVDTVAEARAVVDAARFPPLGRRGGSPGTRAGGWGLGDPRAMVARGNREVLVVVQLETPDAVDAADQVLAVDGIDGVMVGPFDLALASGTAPGDPDLDAQLARVERAAGGRLLAGVAPDTVTAQAMLARGYGFVLVGSDTAMLATATRALVEVPT